jgi:hypothetical protein
MKSLSRMVVAALLCLIGSSMACGQTVIKSDWPKAQMPADVLKYPFAGVTDHGPSSDAYWIKVADGKAENIAKYIALMTAAGWGEEKRGSFQYLTKGDETIEIRAFPDENLTMFVISVFKPPRSWPVKDFPELPELNKGMYSFYTDPDSGTTITIGRVTEADILAYFTLLTTKGWQGKAEELELTRSSPRTMKVMAEKTDENSWVFYLMKE